MPQEINFGNPDDIRLVMLYPELKSRNFWENSKALIIILLLFLVVIIMEHLFV